MRCPFCQGSGCSDKECINNEYCDFSGSVRLSHAMACKACKDKQNLCNTCDGEIIAAWSAL